MDNAFTCSSQRQSDRRKRDQHYKQRQRERGDDAQPNVHPDSLYPVQPNNSARLATPAQPAPYNQDQSSNGRVAFPASGANNQQAAQLLRASLMKNKNQVNGQSEHEPGAGPDTKLLRLNDADSIVLSAVVGNEDTTMAADKDLEEVRLKILFLYRLSLK